MNKEKFYKSIIEQSPVGYAYHKILCDEYGIPCDYEFIEVNNAYEELTGLLGLNILGRKISEVSPDIRESEFDWIYFYGDIAMNGGTKELDQFSEVSNKWYRMNVYSPEQEYFVTQFTDISKEKSQLEELKNFFEVNFDLLCIADIEGNFVKTNKAWETILGYSTNELDKRKFLEFVHPDDLEATLEAITKLDGQMEVINFVNRYLCYDGSYRWIEWRCHPEGKLIYAAARDITERKQMEETLRQSEEKYRQITENILDVVWIADLNLKATYISPSVEKLIGESVNVHLNRTIEEKFSSESLNKINLILLEELEKEKDSESDKDRTLFIDVEQYRADGTTILVNMHVSFLRDENGKVVAIQGVTRDVTEQKKWKKI